MKRWLLLAALVVAISATATVAVQYLPSGPSGDGPDFPITPKISGPAPLAVVEGDLTFTFDSKPQHTTFKRDWVIKNQGEADLVLSRASSTCSCTVGEFDKKGSMGDSAQLTVKPGGSTTLHMSFETRDFSGDHDWSTTVATNDPRHPQLTLAAKGQVYPALIMYPAGRTLDFAGVPNDSDHSGRIGIGSPDRPDFKITKVITSKPNILTAKVEPMSAEERKSTQLKSGGYGITVTLKPGMALGAFRDEVILETDHPQEPEVRLTVVGKVTGPVTVIPDILRWNDIRSSDGGSGYVTLMVRGLRETRFTVERKPESLKVDVAPSDPNSKGGKYRVTVTVPPGTPPQTIEDQIVLKSDHPQAAIVKIPVSIYVRDKG